VTLAIAVEVTAPETWLARLFKLLVLSSENFGCWDKLGCFLTGLTEEKEDSAILDLEGLMTST